MKINATATVLKVLETEFVKRINEAGLGCLECPDKGDRRSLAQRYYQAYEIKMALGLLTEYEKVVVPVLMHIHRHFRMHDFDSSDKNAALSAMWDAAHGDPGCICPSEWLQGHKTLEALAKRKPRKLTE